MKSIERVLRSIKEADEQGDHELAHSLQDALFVTVLTAISTGRATDPVGLAAAALRAQEGDNPRWAG
jgi:hypothetical protein